MNTVNKWREARVSSRMGVCVCEHHAVSDMAGMAVKLLRSSVVSSDTQGEQHF